MLPQSKGILFACMVCVRSDTFDVEFYPTLWPGMHCVCSVSIGLMVACCCCIYCATAPFQGQKYYGREIVVERSKHK